MNSGSWLFDLSHTVSYDLQLRRVFLYMYKKEVVTYQKFFAVILDGKIMKRLTFLFDDSILLIFLTLLYVFPFFVCFILNES